MWCSTILLNNFFCRPTAGAFYAVAAAVAASQWNEVGAKISSTGFCANNARRNEHLYNATRPFVRTLLCHIQREAAPTSHAVTDQTKNTVLREDTQGRRLPFVGRSAVLHHNSSGETEQEHLRFFIVFLPSPQRESWKVLHEYTISWPRPLLCQ